MDAYLTGLEQAAANGHDLAKIHSVASFFVSRVDTEVDKRLDAIGTDEAKALKGKAAIANARLAYAAVRGGLRRRPLARAAGGQGANRQRPLWASTGVKDPDYPTPCTSPSWSWPTPSTPCRRRPWRPSPTTARCRATRSAATTARPRRCFDDLDALGIDYDDVVDVLEREGVEKFDDVLGRAGRDRRGRWSRPVTQPKIEWTPSP